LAVVFNMEDNGFERQRQKRAEHPMIERDKDTHLRHTHATTHRKITHGPLGGRYLGLVDVLSYGVFKNMTASELLQRPIPVVQTEAVSIGCR